MLSKNESNNLQKIFVQNGAKKINFFKNPRDYFPLDNSLFAHRVAENSIGPRHKFLQRYKSDFYKSTVIMKILLKTTSSLHLAFETKSSPIKRINDLT